METTERIVESYFRFARKCLTITNIKAKGASQPEADLLAVRLNADGTADRYHVETTVSISASYRKLTNSVYSAEKEKERIGKSGQRRTLGFFLDKKFGNVELEAKLREYGFEDGNHERLIVTWACDDDVIAEAREHGVTVMLMPDMLREIAEATRRDRTYYTDDTIRTLQLMAMAEGK